MLLKLYKNILLTGIMVLLPILGWAQSAGQLDRSFHYGRGADYQFNYGYCGDGGISATVALPNGKVLIGGSFTNYNGASKNGLARLNTDGTLDESFNSGGDAFGFFGFVRAITLQPDGKILIGGVFNSYNGIFRYNIARLNADGSLDTTFNPATGPSYGVIRAITLQPDGKIFIGGDFTSYNGTSRNNIARLNPDGSLDATFNPSTAINDRIALLALQPNGKVLIVGNSESGGRTFFSCLNADGSFDGTFNPSVGVSDYVSFYNIASLAVQASGKILIGGYFVNSDDNSGVNDIALLNPDGSVTPNTVDRTVMTVAGMVNPLLSVAGRINNALATSSAKAFSAAIGDTMGTNLNATQPAATAGPVDKGGTGGTAATAAAQAAADATSSGFSDAAVGAASQAAASVVVKGGSASEAAQAGRDAANATANTEAKAAEPASQQTATDIALGGQDGSAGADSLTSGADTEGGGGEAVGGETGGETGGGGGEAGGGGGEAGGGGGGEDASEPASGETTGAEETYVPGASMTAVDGFGSSFAAKPMDMEAQVLAVAKGGLITKRVKKTTPAQKRGIASRK